MTSTMPYYSVSGPALLSDFLLKEVDPQFSREQGTLLAGSGADRTVLSGTVLGAILFGAVTVTAGGGNTSGSGTVGSITRSAGCKVGDYKLTCVATASNAGRFQVIDPDGYRLPDATVAVAYTSAQLNFTITDATDYVVGDNFTLSVAAGSGKLIALKLDATDGSQLANSIAAAKTTAPDGVDAPVPRIVRDAIVKTSGLVWPSGATSDEKAAALARLKSTARIYARTGV